VPPPNSPSIPEANRNVGHGTHQADDRGERGGSTRPGAACSLAPVAVRVPQGPGDGVVSDGGRRGWAQPGAGIRANAASASRMWSAHGQSRGIRSHRRRDRCTSRAGVEMIVSRSVLVVTLPQPGGVGGPAGQVVADADQRQPGGSRRRWSVSDHLCKGGTRPRRVHVPRRYGAWVLTS
jgi:hypothetical protein